MIVPGFSKGDVLRADDLQALADGVRMVARQAGGGRGSVGVRAGRRMRFFRLAGEVVLRAEKEGGQKGYAVEWLWERGRFLRVVRGGEVPRVAEVLAGRGEGECVGVYGVPKVKEVGDVYGFELDLEDEPEPVLRAAVWREPEVREDGTCEFEEMGPVVFGVRWPLADFLGRWQGVCGMWPMPQLPMMVLRDVDVGFVQGCRAVLPGERFMPLCRVNGGCYKAGVFRPVWHVWRGRLDKWGQLVFEAGNEEMGDV